MTLRLSQIPKPCRKRPPATIAQAHEYGGWLTCEKPEGHAGPHYSCFLLWEDEGFALYDPKSPPEALKGAP